MAEPRLDDLPDVAKVFVDREEQQILFREAALSISETGVSLLVFHGIGGQGKTWLREKLVKNCDPQTDPEFRWHKIGVVDLAKRRDLTDPDMLLVMIRNAFAASGVDFPSFDLTLALASEAGRPEMLMPRLVNPWLRRTDKLAPDVIGEAAAGARAWLSGEEASALLGDMITQLPFVGALLKRGGAWAFKRGKEKYLHETRPHLQKLHSRNGAVKAYDEVSKLLGYMLARDLDYHRNHSPYAQYVLFVDEYERVFDQGGASDRYEENLFDRQMRTFLSECDALLAVFVMREQLPWGRQWEQELAGRQFMLDGLPQSDARTYLEQVPIVDAAIRDAMVSGARESNGADALVYPLLLDMQVEHWRRIVAAGETPQAADFRVDAKGFEDRCQSIVERLMRLYDSGLQETLKRLAFARRIDVALFGAVAEAFHTGLPAHYFERFDNLSFVRRGSDGQVFMHQAVAEIIKEIQPTDYAEKTQAFLFDHYDRAAAVDDHRAVTQATIEALFEAAWHRRQLGRAANWVRWLSQRAGPLRIAARFAPAELLWREALNVVETALGPDHLDVTTVLNNLAELLTEQGKYAEGESLHRRALAIGEATLGADHPEVATTLNNLASLLRTQSKYAEAEPLFRRALAIREGILGPEHRTIASTLNNLASLFKTQGKYAEAEPLFRRALTIGKATLGPDHPDVSRIINNLARLLQAQGKLSEAEQLYRQDIVVSEATLGPNHPHVAAIVDNLAGLLVEQGKYAEAEALHRRALVSREAMLGQDHPAVAATLNNLAGLLRSQGKYTEAELLHRRDLAICEATLGTDHPDVATALNNLGLLLQQQGKDAEAEPLYKRALTINEAAFGLHHPDLAPILNNMASLFHKQGNYAEAEPLHRRGLAISEAGLGPDHPVIATALSNLAELFTAQGKYAEAEPLYRRAIRILLSSFPKGHPNLDSSMKHYLSMLQERDGKLPTPEDLRRWIGDAQ